MAILGERWTLVILREAFNRRRRFEDIQRDLGIARNVLADRLQTLVGEGSWSAGPTRSAPGASSTGSRRRAATSIPCSSR